MKFSAILFDLDGTLTDPIVGITRSVQLALARFGIDVPDRETLAPYIGPPLLESFERLHGLNPAQARIAAGYYRDHFSTNGLFENEVYPGIAELLRDLQAGGATLVVATAKPTIYAEQIVTHFGLDRYIDLVVGSNLDHTRVAKTEVIAHVLLERRGIDRGTAVMVGDREHDIIGARHNGLTAVGVTYGYGTNEELRGAGATVVADSLHELAALLLSEVVARRNVGVDPDT